MARRGSRHRRAARTVSFGSGLAARLINCLSSFPYCIGTSTYSVSSRSELALVKILVLLFLLMPGLVVAEDQYFDSDGVSIRYRVAGTGPTVVLLHGWSGRLENWVDIGLFDALASNYRVVVLDARGHGLSDKPIDQSMYGIKMAEDVRNLMDHLEVQKAHMMGYSQGALLTGVFMDRWPDRLITATLAAGTPILIWDASTKAFFDGIGEWARQRLDDPNADAEQDWLALAMAAESTEDFVVSGERLATLDVPVLGLMGSEDQGRGGIRGTERIRAFGEGIPTFDLVVVEGATHYGETGLQRHPEFQDALQAFIGRNSEN